MVSIIVPVFNAEKTIVRCIKSILNQTNPDFELILVNDGSSDASEKLCKEYSLQDSRIVYVKKQNEGVSSARNKGMELARGEYITFIDSDDYVSDMYVEHLVAYSSNDLVLSGFHSSEGISFVPKEQKIDASNRQQSIPNIVSHPYLLYTPWAKLFKKQIIEKNNICFDQSLRLYEDTIFVLTYLTACCSVYIAPYADYEYIGQWGGLSKYILTKEEIDYRCRKEYEVLGNIENVFHCKIDKYHRCYALNYINNIYRDYTDKDCLRFYGKYHSEEETVEFLKDIYMFPSYQAISQLKINALNCSLKSIYKSIKELNHFISIPENQLSFTRRDEKLVYFLIRNSFLISTCLILKIYGCIKYVKL